MRVSRSVHVQALLVALALCVTPTEARADGAALIPIGGATMQGCPGDIVVFDLLAFYDNCACQIPVPAAPCTIAYTSITSNGPGNFVGAFIPPPPGPLALDPCTPDPNPGCPAHPATGIVQGMFQVSVAIPLNATPGDTDSLTVTVDICPGVPAQVKLDVDVIDCGPPAVPTVGEWGLIWLGALVLGAGLYMLPRMSTV